MSGSRNPRAGVEDLWHKSVVEVDPATGRKTRKKVQSERFGRGKRWRARYVDPNGNERGPSFDTKKAAQKFLDSDVTTKVVTGTWVDPDRSGVQFSIVAEKWFSSKSFRKPKTVAGYRSLLDGIVIPRWGEVPLRDIEFEDIQDWIVELSQSGSSRFEGRGLSASRVIQSYQVLNQVLRYAIKAKRLATNPANEVDLPALVSGERRYLTHLEVMRLAMAAGRFRPLVLTLAYTGIRFGEAIALRAYSVNPETQRITVARSATPVTGRGYVETGTKNHTTRALPIPATLANELRVLLEDLEVDALIFPSRKGGFLTSTEFRWVFDQAAQEVGLKGVVPHGLRHTAASLAISAGANIKVVQRMLGHKTAMLTLDLYGHLFPDDLDALAAGLESGAQAAAYQLRTG
ncbi:tyrosine-type recombinase/integrase [Nocardia tengchongensis]